jgi:glycerophosphoryl diester phosphodiesterase
MRISRSILAAGLVQLVCVASLPFSAPAMAKACPPGPAPAAHRGGTERYTENTRDSFRDAGNLGIQTWETDVQFTSDDVPVIMHDDTVDGTTDGTGLVSDHTAAEIAAMRTADDQPIPTLRELVNDAQVDGVTVLVELKSNPTGAQWATLRAALESRPNMTSKLIITSFDKPTLTAAAAATHAPAYARGLIQDVGDVDPATVTPYAHILIKAHDAITASRMSKWTAGGLQVYAWTVDTVSEWDRMTWYPLLKGVITNKPAAMITWQRTRTC